MRRPCVHSYELVVSARSCVSRMSSQFELSCRLLHLVVRHKLGIAVEGSLLGEDPAEIHTRKGLGGNAWGELGSSELRHCYRDCHTNKGTSIVLPQEGSMYATTQPCF